MEKGITQEKIKDIAISASDKIYEQDDLGPVQSIKTSLNLIVTQMSQVAQYLQDNEYEITTASKNEEKVSFSIRYLHYFIKFILTFLAITSDPDTIRNSQKGTGTNKNVDQQIRKQRIRYQRA